ncbi:hypothetical protein UlMin_035722 [Ulmus minor]
MVLWLCCSLSGLKSSDLKRNKLEALEAHKVEQVCESVEPNVCDSSVGHFSVVGAQPSMEIVVKENKVIIMDHEKGNLIEEIVDDHMAFLAKILEGWNPQLIDDLPNAFCGGWVGYFSYDTVRYVEKRKVPFSKAPKDDRNIEDIHLGLYDGVLVFDHVEKVILHKNIFLYPLYVIHWVRLDRYSSIETAYEDGVKCLASLLARVQSLTPPRLSAGYIDIHTRHFGGSLENSNMTSEEYKKMVLEAKEHILAGDIFQIVLSQHFERRTFANPFEIYHALRVVNPSPYMTYLKVASSPEILTRVNKVVNRPLVGTARRGKTSKEDENLELQLLSNEKQCAEHIMLVDLGQNDVGKMASAFIDEFSHLRKIPDSIQCTDFWPTISEKNRGSVQCYVALLHWFQRAIRTRKKQPFSAKPRGKRKLPVLNLIATISAEVQSESGLVEEEKRERKGRERGEELGGEEAKGATTL